MKSTCAYLLMYLLKQAKYRVGYASEFAKDLVHAGSIQSLENQVYVTCNQQKLVDDMFKSGAQIVVTDSPLRLGVMYARHNGQTDVVEPLRAVVDALESRWTRLNVLSVRTDNTYEQFGRLQTEEASKKLEQDILSLDKMHFKIEDAKESQIRDFFAFVEAKMVNN